MIHSFWEYSEKIFMKIHEEGDRILALHKGDAQNRFPDVDLECI